MDGAGSAGPRESSDQVPRARVSRCEWPRAAPSALRPAASAQAGGLWGVPREREEMEHSGRAVGAGPRPEQPRHGARRPPRPGSCGQKTAGCRPRRLGGRGGRRSARDISDSRATPRWVLPYPASVYLPMEWAREGGSGDRGARQKLGARCLASLGPSVQEVAARGWSPAVLPWPWLQACPHGHLVAGANASAREDAGGPWPGLGGCPALPAGSSSTRSPRRRPAASASGGRPCGAYRRSR